LCFRVWSVNHSVILAVQKKYTCRWYMSILPTAQFQLLFLVVNRVVPKLVSATSQSRCHQLTANSTWSTTDALKNQKILPVPKPGYTQKMTLSELFFCAIAIYFFAQLIIRKRQLTVFRFNLLSFISLLLNNSIVELFESVILRIFITPTMNYGRVYKTIINKT